MKKFASLASISLMLIALFAPKISAQGSTRAPEIDVLRGTVIRSPDAGLLAMMTGVADVWPSPSAPMDLYDMQREINGGLMRTSDIETLADSGHLITENLAFHVGYIGYNTRADQSYRRSDPEALAYWPLKDVTFRHALIHCYDPSVILPPIYNYVVTPVRSLVPPAQSDWFYTGVPVHPYNPGSPFTSTPGDHSACGILLGAGYTFVDDDSSGTVTDADYWMTPAAVPLPTMEIWTPLLEVAPPSFQLGQEFASDLAEIGLAATMANGNRGLLSLGRDLNEYLSDVHDHANFDAYMCFGLFGRLPHQLYLLVHSGFDTLANPGSFNAPGINDAELDSLLETMTFGFSFPEQQEAAFEVQSRLYNESYSYALTYMALYSKSAFNAFAPHLEGIIKSPGYGAANKWTWLNINWESGHERIEDGKEVVICIIQEHLDSFNPCYASTAYDWWLIGNTLDGLTGVNPYTHDDISWLAEDWLITETVAGMEIDFVVNDTVEWQDGKPFTAYDVEFCLEFLRDYQVPRYAETWQAIVDVVVTDATHVKVITSEAGIDLFYDVSSLAAMLPEHTWNRFGDPADPAERQAVLDYDPNELYNVAEGYTPGPHPPPTNLFGTGPFVFQFYDDVNFYSDLWRNEYYFKSTTEIHNLKAEMFHQAGDLNYDGVIDLLDQFEASMAYGSMLGDPDWNPNADLDGDGIVDIFDVLGIGMYLGWQREYGYQIWRGLSASSPSKRAGAQPPWLIKTGEPSADETTIYIDPEHLSNETLQAEESFTIDVDIANVTNLLAYHFRVTFNPDILNVVSITPGDFFTDPHIWHSVGNNEAGFVRYAIQRKLGEREGVSGSGRLATIEFQVVEYGSSSLEQKGFTKLASSITRARRIDHLALDGYFRNTGPGDANGDGTVDIFDIGTISAHWYPGPPIGPLGYHHDGDINLDHSVDIFDIGMTSANWGNTYP